MAYVYIQSSAQRLGSLRCTVHTSSFVSLEYVYLRWLELHTQLFGNRVDSSIGQPSVVKAL